MSRLKLAFCLAAVVAGAQGCAGPSVQDYQDGDVELARYRTYRWLTQTEIREFKLNEPEIDYIAGYTTVKQVPEVETRVKELVARSLEQAGYKPSLNANPDFLVTFYVQAQDGDWISTWSGRTPESNDIPIVISPGFDRGRLWSMREDTVYLVLYDTKTRKPAWTGSVRKSRYGPEFGPKEVAQAVSDLVKKLREATA